MESVTSSICQEIHNQSERGRKEDREDEVRSFIKPRIGKETCASCVVQADNSPPAAIQSYYLKPHLRNGWLELADGKRASTVH